MSTPTSADLQRPVLRVLRGGDPTEEELAALVAVLTTRTAAAPSQRSLRQPLSSWVVSGLAKGTRTRA
jgi:hypothetical protein